MTRKHRLIVLVCVLVLIRASFIYATTAWHRLSWDAIVFTLAVIALVFTLGSAAVLIWFATSDEPVTVDAVAGNSDRSTGAEAREKNL